MNYFQQRLYLLVVFFFLTAWCHGAYAQELGLSNSDKFKRCLSDGDVIAFEVGISNISDRNAYQENSFSIDWGDGSSKLTNISYDDCFTEHIYSNWGVFNLKFTAKLKGSGGLKEIVYRVINLAKPAVGIEEGQTGSSSCVDSETKIEISGFLENPSTTNYILTFGDENKAEYTHQELESTQGSITHIYSKASCELNHNNGFTITITAINECDIERKILSPGHYIVKPPTSNFDFTPEKGGCTEKEVQFSNKSDEGKGKDCAPLEGLKYKWDFGKEGVGLDQKEEKNPVVIYDEAGEYNVTLTIKSSSLTCAYSSKEMNVRVIESVKAGFTMPSDKGCDLLSLIFADASKGDEREWEWSVDENGVNGGYESKSDIDAPNANIDFHYGEYLVTQEVRNHCSWDMKDTVIKVNKDPEVFLNKLDTICSKGIKTGEINLLKYVSYSWFNNERKPEWEISPAGGWEFLGRDNAQSEYPEIQFNEPGDYTLTVRLKSAGCSGTKLTATQKIHIYDPAISLDEIIMESPAEICVTEKVIFTGKAIGEGLQEIKESNWKVTKDGIELTTGVIKNIVEDRTEITFDDFGDYKIEFNVKGPCDKASKPFQVKVKKNPEIVKFDPLPLSCPRAQDILYLSKYIKYAWSGNKSEVEWNISPNNGGFSYENRTNKNSLYPVIEFTKPGKYTLTATLVGVGCGDLTKLTETQEIHIYNPEINLDEIKANEDTICEGEAVSFEGMAVGELVKDIEKIDWKISNKNGEDVTDSVIINVISNSKTDITFPRFGEYKVALNVKGPPCSEKSKDFDIVTQRAPEITFWKFFDPICPNELFYPMPYADYKPNGNNNVEINWSITRSSDGTLPLIEGENGFEPKVSELTEWGDYTITVTLTNPTRCEPKDKLSASAVLVVNNPYMDLDIKPDTNTICTGGRINIINKSNIAVEPSYTWSVVSGGSEVSSGVVVISDVNSPKPTITFNQSGIYTINRIIEGACERIYEAYPITVQENPTIEIKEIAPMCPGVLELSDATITYKWNDKWNGEIEGLRKVKWSLKSSPPNAQYTPIESPEWNEFYPKLEFKTPGNYILQAKLDPIATNCGDDDIIEIQEITIYDPKLEIDIKPEAVSGLVDKENNKYQFIERAPLSIKNNSRGEGLTYLWSVDQAGCKISDLTVGDPTITFDKYGIYKLILKITGTCSSTTKEFIFDIKGVPNFTFTQIPNRCDTWEALDITEFLHCDSSGSSTIICDWEIEPGNYELVEGTNINEMFPKIRFTKNGVYTLTLNATAEYGGLQKVSMQVNVLNSFVDASAILTETEWCIDDILEITARNTSIGDSLTYTWKMTPEEGREVSFYGNDFVAKVSEARDYQIHLKAENICDVDEVTFDVRAFSKPEVEQLKSKDLGTECELGYKFIGTEHVGPIEVNNDSLEKVLWTIDPIGVVWENATNDRNEYPNISFEGGKTYNIKGEFKNGCSESVFIEYTVKVDEYEKVTIMQKDALCAHARPILLEANPLGGEWSCDDENALKTTDDGKSYFKPYKNENDRFNLIYERGNGVCVAKDSIKITVNALPEVHAGKDTSACVNHNLVKLIAIDPSEGKWQGTGVSDGMFDPKVSGVGDFRLEYWYTDPTTTCQNLDTIIMTVHELPNPNFKVSEFQCEGIDSVYTPEQLGVGNHFSWDFDNGYIGESDDEPISYIYSTAGEYKVVLTATSKYGCINVSDSTELTVLNLPPTAEFIVEDTAGCGPFTTEAKIEPLHFAAEYSNLEYKWDYGNGNITTNLAPVVQTYQAGLLDTIYPLVFKVYNVCGEQLDTIDIGVWSKAVSDFVITPKEEGCSPMEVQFINKSTGSNNSYSWDFDDDKSSKEQDPKHTFNTDAMTSFFDIVLTATNRCILDGAKTSRRLKVKPNSIVVGFNKSGTYICAGDTICFENYTVDRDPIDALNYSWNFEPGVFYDVGDTCYQYNKPGAYRVTLKVDNGCSKGEASDSIFVHEIPKLELESTLPICEDLELEFNMTADQSLKNISWNFGDGSPKENGLFSILHAFQEPGEYEVKVRGEGDQIPSCPNETTTVVKIWSNPRIKIASLDTMSCSPFLFQPQTTATSFDFTTWDYGDGTPISSEMEHLYINDTDSIQRYHIVAYVENNNNCKEEHKGFVSIYNAPKAAWDKEISYGRPEKVKFVNLSKDYTESIWYLPSGKIVNSFEDQTLTFNDEDVYSISLAVVNKYGCRDSLCQEHRSYDGGLYFPNSFIPHSLNPKVNQFNGIGMGLKEYRLEIFDMYGNKIWETTTLEEGIPSEGWKGQNKEGQFLPQGTYMWRAKAIFFSEDLWTGDNNRSGNTQSTQGTVLLLGQ